jgi:hypothetical protein
MAAPATPVPGLVPNDLQSAINRIATAAANIQDINTVSLLLRVQEWLVQLNPVYQSGTITTPALAGWPTSGYPFTFGFGQGIQADANAIVAKQTALTGPQLGA